MKQNRGSKLFMPQI